MGICVFGRDKYVAWLLEIQTSNYVVKGTNDKFNLVCIDQAEGKSNKQTSVGIVGITKKMGIDC